MLGGRTHRGYCTMHYPIREQRPKNAWARSDFRLYTAALDPSVAVVVVTGDQALYANLLLTVGV